MPTMQPALAVPAIPDPMDAPALRWGILGPGGIANTFASAAREGTRSSVVAVGSRSRDRASVFARRHGIARAYGSYEELVADDEVDAVYIASPHSEHHEHALLALHAGKPVLVEKAFTRNIAETEEILTTAERAGLLAAEAMWSRYLPHYDVVRRTVQDGTLGEVVRISADHGQLLWPDGPQRLADPALAGGALLDLGVYPVAFVDHVLGGLRDVRATGTLSAQGVDITVGMTARAESDVPALMSCTMAAADATAAAVIGTRARIELSSRFYEPSTTVRLIAPDGAALDEYHPDPVHGFRFQIAEIARAVSEGRGEPWSVPWEATRRVMGILDEVRRQVGVRYPGE
jgi:predicted dehydrogenase